MAKVYIILQETTDTWRSSRSKMVDSVFRTMDAARNRIKALRDEYRSDKDITLCGEHWHLGEYPYYFANYIENYYVKIGSMENVTNVEFTIEDYELAD